MDSVVQPRSGGRTTATFTTADSMQSGTGSSFQTDEDTTQVILSLAWTRGSVGAALYDGGTSEITLLPDQEDLGPMHSFLFVLLTEVKPTLVVLSASVDETLKGAIAEFLTGGNVAAKSGRDVVQVLPNKDFAYETGRHRLLYLQLPENPKGLSDDARFVYMSSLVDFNAISTVRAAGGLLNFLDRWNRSRLHDLGDDFVVRGISSCSLNDRVWIPQATFSYLQIFKQEWHPSVYKFGFAAKEGLSLFGILNHCKSKVGERELRSIFCRPTRDRAVLALRHNMIAYFLSPRNQSAVVTLQECLGNVKDVSHILTNMRKAATSAAEWKVFYKTAESVVAVHGICQTRSPQAEETDVVWKMKTLPMEELARVTLLINKIVDFEASETAERFVVRPGVNPMLDEKKRIYNGLPDLLTKVAYEQLEQLGDEIADCQVVYLPQIGYLVNFSADNITGEPPDLQFMFNCDGKKYYKSSTTKGLDAMLGDTLCEIMGGPHFVHDFVGPRLRFKACEPRCPISDRETEIMHKLQDVVLRIADVFQEAISVCGELDALLSLVKAAKEGNYVRPVMADESVVFIEDGRHPLVEHTSMNFVPNSYASGGSCSRLKVITGPNSCGKSIYMKQVALIVYLAHIGSYVPARAAEIGPVDAILSCSHPEESLLLGLSSFAVQLNQIAQIVRGKGMGTLIVMDEFGKGTRLVDGASLLVGALQGFLQEPRRCPHVLVSTHFDVLPEFLPACSLLSYQTFDTIEYDGEMVYLYRLKEGCAEKSCAGAVGMSAGLRRSIVQRQAEICAGHDSDAVLRARPCPRKLKNKMSLSESCMRSAVERLENCDLSEAGIVAVLDWLRATFLRSPVSEP